MPVSDFKVVKINSKDTQMYYIGTLAKRLGRTTTAIRIWENSGLIPATWFRDKFGRRLYTGEQLDIIVNNVEKYGIRQGIKVAQTDFSKDCHEQFEQLRIKYFGGKNNA